MPYPYYNSPYSPNFTPYGAQQPYLSNLSPNAQQAPQTANNGIVWVQGEAGAKSYLVGAGNSALLMDSEQSRFYIKSTDSSGMPMPLRIFEYNEITAGNSPTNDLNVNNGKNYVTHEELENRLKEIEIKPIVKREVDNDGKPVV